MLKYGNYAILHKRDILIANSLQGESGLTKGGVISWWRGICIYNVELKYRSFRQPNEPNFGTWCK